MAGQNVQGAGVFDGKDVEVDWGDGRPMSTSMRGTGHTGVNEATVHDYLTAIAEMVGAGKGSGNLSTPEDVQGLYGVWGRKPPVFTTPVVQ
jgi:hypothetical protein